MKAILAAFIFLVGSMSFADTTCDDRDGRSVTFRNGALIFEGMDSIGIPGGVEYSVIGSRYEHVPGGPSYAEYTGAYESNRTLVRFSGIDNPTSAEVWAGRFAHGRAVFKGQCR